MARQFRDQRVVLPGTTTAEGRRAIAIATVTTVIVELDRPAGVFRIRQAAMLDTRNMMDRNHEGVAK